LFIQEGTGRHRETKKKSAARSQSCSFATLEEKGWLTDRIIFPSHSPFEMVSRARSALSLLPVPASAIRMKRMDAWTLAVIYDEIIVQLTRCGD
jgi:hypothetical protein